MEQSCLVCLEQIKVPTTLNKTGCECKIYSHTECLEKWFQQKQQMECPICHKSPIDTITIQMPTQDMLQAVQITHVEIIRQSIQENRYQNHDKIVGFCACMCLAWGVAFAILDAVMNH